MKLPSSTSRRSLLAPEIMQTSLTDCGPAALKAVLEGFGIEVDYDWLRERCETDVDGTSIDALAALGRELGLSAQQVLVPRDSLLLPEARCLPAIVVTRSGGGLLHFIVLWRAWRGWVQIMDPGSGRRWLRKRALLELMPDLPIPVTAERWRKWAARPNGREPLQARMGALGISRSVACAFIEQATSDPSYRTFAALDAGVRMVAALVESGGLRRGAEARSLLSRLTARTRGEEIGSLIPPRFHWVAPNPASPGKLIARGSVIVHFSRASSGAAARAPAGVSSQPRQTTRQRPLLALARLARADLLRTLPWAGVGLISGALLVPIEALVLRGLLSIQRYLALDYQRAGGVLVVLLLMAAGLWIELGASAAVRRLGLGFETRLRASFLERLPLLDEKYLRSRPSSDMASRGHALHLVREIPVLCAQGMRAALTLLATAAGLVWLHPPSAALVILGSVASLVVPNLARRSLGEASLRLRTHATALDRFYLDALLGAIPIRVHGAERAVRCEHETLLSEWARTADALHGQSTRLQMLQAASSTAIAVALVGAYVLHGGPLSGILLFAFWALRIPALAQELAMTQISLRSLRGTLLRLLAPLEAPLRAAMPAALHTGSPAPATRALAIQFEHVTVRAAGHELLEGVNLSISAAEHVAIVGASGAGKSSLLALLLGWHEPATGRITVDGELLDAARLARLREETAWVDPALRLWDRSLYDNLVFGASGDPQAALPSALAHAELLPVLEQLREGLQANLGEGGVRVSGGQGQRVRLGRALMRERARLVLLDEPFRGLPRDQRCGLLRSVREHWAGATLLFVSHDIRDSADFDRVLVVAGGRIVEDGAPALLASDPRSRYAALLQAERTQAGELWRAAHWRRTSIAGGALREGDAA
jgi:ABC-type bacteriocin/lantibiotic exporter with double-glycine peptidase domain